MEKNYRDFYEQLFEPIEQRVGKIDGKTIMAIIGFDAGGPISLCTVNRDLSPFVTYVTCELSVRGDQCPGAFGRYELMMSCDDKKWAHTMLTNVARMSFNSILDDGNTIDAGQVVAPDCPMQGLIIEEFARMMIDGSDYGILRLHGVTRDELEFAMQHGPPQLLERLKRSGIYPNTSVKRIKSVLLGP